MSDHDFEKQIQQKLDELKIPPADKVWSGVEAQIRRDKRRRRGVLFFPLLLVFIGVGFYFIFRDNLFFQTDSVQKSSSENSNSYKDNSAIENSSAGKNEANKAQQPDDNTSSLKRSETKSVKVHERNKTVIPDAVNAGNAVDNKEKNTNNTVEFKRTGVPGPETRVEKDLDNTVAARKNRKQDKNKNQQEAINDQLVPDRNIATNERTKIIDQTQKDVTLPPAVKKDSVDKQDKALVPVPDSMANKSKSDIVDKKATDSSDHITQVKPVDTSSSGNFSTKKKTDGKKIRQSGWKWGLNASAGISNLIDEGFFDGVLGGEKALVADVSRSSLNSAPNTGGSPVVVHRPSAIEKGFSFSIGGFVQKELSKRFSLSTGIRYGQYTNNIQVGNRVDSGSMVQLQNAFGSLNVSQYYRAAPVPVTQKYTNRFHFIELPVLFHAQLNKSKRLPLFWNTGLSLSYLVATNALHFDGNTGIYYKDNTLFNKLQANLSTELSLSLWNASAFPVQIGPQLQYGLTNLMKHEVSASKHLFYFGLNTRVFLKK